jgi:DNA-binding beta-propeller fold protein YncE
MKSVMTLIAGILLAVSALAQDATGLAHPESITSDGHFLYVTNVGKALDPTAKDGDGYISKLSLEGKMVTPSITTEKLNAPKGTAIVKGVLYVADIDHIIGIQLASGKKIADIDLSGSSSSFLNDLTVKDDLTLFVSAMDIGKVLEVNVTTGAFLEVATVKGANGIYYDKATKRLYTCSFDFQNMQAGEIGVVSWKNKIPAYEKIGDVHGAFDGLALLNDHTLIVSDWGALDHPAGFVEKIDLNTKKATKLDWPVFSGPADFFFDAKGKRLVIPALVEGKVVIQGL